MTSDSREPAFDWGESGEGLVVEGRDVAPAAPRPKTETPVLLAVFGGLYAVWTIAWVLAIVAAPTQKASSLLDAIMYQFGEFLGIVAAPLWFGVVWWLTSDISARFRALFLAAGLVLLAPLPFILPIVLAAL
jgi:hypothetical protein